MRVRRPGSRSGSSVSSRCSSVSRRHPGADLDRDRVADAAEVLDVRRAHRGAHAQPREVGRQVVPAGAPRHLSGLRLLVGQHQRLVAGEEVDALELAHLHAGQRLHEAQGLGDRLHHALVLDGVGRVLEEAQVPVLGVVEIGEAAVDQRADEVERQRRAVVAAHHAPGVGTAVLGRERQSVHQVAAIGRQRHVAARLEVLGARLGVLPGEATDADHPLLRAVHQHQAHLEQDLELAGDDLGRAVLEALGAVAALEQEALPVRGLGQEPAQRLDLPRGDQRRQPRQGLGGAIHLDRVGIARLLRRGQSFPGVRRPVFHVVRTGFSGPPSERGSYHAAGARPAPPRWMEVSPTSDSLRLEPHSRC